MRTSTQLPLPIPSTARRPIRGDAFTSVAAPLRTGDRAAPCIGAPGWACTACNRSAAPQPPAPSATKTAAPTDTSRSHRRRRPRPAGGTESAVTCSSKSRPVTTGTPAGGGGGTAAGCCRSAGGGDGAAAVCRRSTGGSDGAAAVCCCLAPGDISSQLTTGPGIAASATGTTTTRSKRRSYQTGPRPHSRQPSARSTATGRSSAARGRPGFGGGADLRQRNVPEAAAISPSTQPLA